MCFHYVPRQIPPAYTQDSIVLSRVVRGSTDTAMFEDFNFLALRTITEPKSILVMDDASFYHSEKIACADASVKLVYLPLYSPDLNLTMKFFTELKGFIKRNWGYFGDDPSQGLVPSANGVSKLLVRKESAQEVIFSMRAYR